MNGALAWENVVLNLKTFGRYHADGTSDFSGYAVESVRRLKNQAQIVIPWCCGDFDETELIQTAIGWGQVKTAEIDTKTSRLTLELLKQ